MKALASVATIGMQGKRSAVSDQLRFGSTGIAGFFVADTQAGAHAGLLVIVKCDATLII